MTKLWTLITQLHSLAGPVLTLLYPLYASVVAIESPSKEDDEQWLSYWIIYSFLTLGEMVLQPALEWIPIWYEVKLLLAAWLVLPQFKGAAYLYGKLVRENIRRYATEKEKKEHKQKQVSPKKQQDKKSPTGSKGKKFVDFIIPKKGDQEAY
ncbi:HVA22-like protein e [Lotus japonicus]|uniref:HVA22-like protein e n=1 Tax=Lotus japonicus TaxID=34305 RepID=UPI002583E058|nr:HVA22-like protein e [Lotus japonicus]